MAFFNETYNLIVQASTKGFGNVNKSLGTMQASFKKLTNVISSFQTFFVGAIAFNLVKSLGKAAGEAETTNRRFQRTFRESAGEVQKAAEQIAESTNRAVVRVKGGLVAFNSFFRGLGFATAESTKFSKSIQGAALDLASFYGLTDEGAQKRFISALAGSPEVLDQFGINLKQAALQIELYNMGIKTTVQNTDELTKTTARLSIINRAMTANGILGDAVRNVDSYDNQVKKLEATLLELSQSVGTVVVPALIELFDVLGDISNQIKDVVGDADILELERQVEINKLIDERLDNQRIIARLRGKEVNELSELESMLESVDAKDQKRVELNGVMVKWADIRRGIENRILSIKQRQAIVEQQIIDAQVKFIDGKTKRADDIKLELDRQKELAQLKRMETDDLRDLVSNYGRQIKELTFGDLISAEQSERVKELRKDLAFITKTIAEREQFFSGNLGKRGSSSLTTKPTTPGAPALRELPQGIPILEYMSEFADTGFSNTMKDIGDSMAMSIGGVFAESVSAVLEGSAKFGTAFKRALDEMAKVFAAEFTMRAIYHGVIGTAMTIGGNFAGAAKNFGMAGAYGSGAALLGGLSAAIPNPRTGLGGARASASRSSFTGQSSFGQVLVAEVSGDKLRFVLEESRRRSFRRNGG